MPTPSQPPQTAVRLDRPRSRFLPLSRSHAPTLSTLTPLFTLLTLCTTLTAAPKADHIVLIVWDGMRPDFVTPRHTPNLARLAAEGVFFKAHHPVYISSTEVNGAALATGNYPNRSGIIANQEYRPELNCLEPVATEGVDSIRRGDSLTGGKYLPAPTLAEILQANGLRTVVAGTKPVAILQDRAIARSIGARFDSTLVYNGRAIPSSRLPAIVKTNGKEFPAATIPNVARDRWTTKALLDTLWKDAVPRLSVLWLSEPDASQHNSSPGSPNALAALASADANLGLILAALEVRGLRQKTDLLLVSDHGFSTIQRGVDVADVLKKAGFRAFRKFEDPEPGQILVVGLGGSVLFYVVDQDQAVIGRLVRFLQKSDFAGVIFTRSALPGTFDLAQARLDTQYRQPDAVLAMRWSAATNAFRTPGLLVADGGTAGAGTHGSLSRFDMRNTLVACGPDFRRGFADELPTGNADIAPTLLHILGLPPPQPMDGRVLTEALADCPNSDAKPQTTTIEATAELGGKRWRQYLRITTLDGRPYLDEGNPVPPP